MQITEFLYRVTELDVDLMGHLNNAGYLKFFELGRWDTLATQGWTFERIAKDGLGPVILEFKVQFFKEVKARQDIRIKTDLQPPTGKVGPFTQEMYGLDGTLHCTLEGKYGVLDVQTRKLVKVTPPWELPFTPGV